MVIADFGQEYSLQGICTTLLLLLWTPTIDSSGVRILAQFALHGEHIQNVEGVIAKLLESVPIFGDFKSK